MTDIDIVYKFLRDVAAHNDRVWFAAHRDEYDRARLIFESMAEQLIGGLAVIDMEQNRYLGRLTGMMQNTRHLVLHDRYLYLSVNTAGYVQRYTLDSIYAAIQRLDGKTARLNGAENCQVMPGARTLCLSPDGRYAYVACNTASQICVVDTRTMEMIAHIPADSYPVGMDLSACGRYLITTSQGRNDCGGNAVDIYKVERK